MTYPHIHKEKIYDQFIKAMLNSMTKVYGGVNKESSRFCGMFAPKIEASLGHRAMETLTKTPRTRDSRTSIHHHAQTAPHACAETPS